jgi:hypothetical protein
MDNKILEELNKLIDKYNWTPRPIPMEIVEDLTKLRIIIESVGEQEQPKAKTIKEKTVAIEQEEEIKQEDTQEDTNTPQEKTIAQLRAEYKSRFNKNPFG